MRVEHDFEPSNASSKRDLTLCYFFQFSKFRLAQFATANGHDADGSSGEGNEPEWVTKHLPNIHVINVIESQLTILKFVSLAHHDHNIYIGSEHHHRF